MAEYTEDQLFTERMRQEMNLLCQMPPFRMLQRHIIAANADYDSPNDKAVPVARAIANALYERLMSAIR